MSDLTFETLAATMDYIEERQHKLTRETLKVIGVLAAEIMQGKDRNIQPERIALLCGYINVLRIELDHHLMMEEEIVFPLIRRMEASEKSGSHAPVGRLPGFYVDHLMSEHVMILRVFTQIRHNSGDYRAEEKSPPKLAELYGHLGLLHTDLGDHIRYENEYLFPKFEELALKK